MNRGRRKYIPMKTLKFVWAKAKADGVIVQNGYTFGLLRNHLNREIFHKLGVGFYYYPESDPLKTPA